MITKYTKIFFILFFIVVILALVIDLFLYNNVEILEKKETEYGPVWIFERHDKRCMSFLDPQTNMVQSCFLLTNPKY